MPTVPTSQYLFSSQTKAFDIQIYTVRCVKSKEECCIYNLIEKDVYLRERRHNSFNFCFLIPHCFAHTFIVSVMVYREEKHTRVLACAHQVGVIIEPDM